MAKFRMVHTEFWDDPKVVEEMTPEDKLFFLYLLTNGNTTQIGIYQITKKQMAFDIGYSLETINSLLDRLINHHKLIKYNPETREIAIKNWGKYNLNRGGKPMLDCVKSELTEVKDRELISYVGENVQHSDIKNLYVTSDDTSTIRGQYKEEEKEEEEYKEKDKDKYYTAKIKDLLPVFSPITNFNKLNKKYWDVIRETRKTGNIAKSVIYNSMKKWEKYDPVVIEYALKTHIDAHQGKREEYTIGIMRKTTKEEALDRMNVIPFKPRKAAGEIDWDNL
ncbi:DNA replication protein DnaD [Oceanobacillus caeni]